MQYDLKCLAVPLPEDVLKLKYYGDIERLNRVIDRKLEKDIPWALKERLRLEKEIMALWPRAYPHTEENALRMLREEVLIQREAPVSASLACTRPTLGRDFSRGSLMRMTETSCRLTATLRASS